MLTGSALALWVGALLAHGALVSSTSLGHLGDRAAGGATSAVISASGSGHLLNASAKQTVTPPCAEACQDYTKDVSETTESVCIDSTRSCSLNTCDTRCYQRFNDDCQSFCSKWAAEVDETTLNVCLKNEKRVAPKGKKEKKGNLPFDCSAESQCPADTTRCKQKRVPDCWIFCEGYEFSGNLTVTQDTTLICQNMNDASSDFGVCLPPPCNMQAHNSMYYEHASICKQELPNCPNSCAAGSDEPDGLSVCFNNDKPYSSWSATSDYEKCTNEKECPMDHIRCKPVTQHQDKSKLPLEDGSGSIAATLVEHRARQLTWAESRAEQQRAKVAAFRKAHARSSLMRRDSSDGAK